MQKTLKLGIIGLSQGNGHPYSWSAIFNGYNPHYMKDCGFPVIPEYLSKQKFPDNCIKNAEVRHIWTQDKKLSEHIAHASNIPYVCNKMEDLLGNVDAVLLARDDAENHFEMVKIFIEAGLPVYIDKPLAFNMAEAEKIYNLEKYDGQIFTCSALSYAPELKLNPNLGEIQYIDATIFKDWKKYGIHIIDPTIRLCCNNASIIDVTSNKFNNNSTIIVNWSNNITTNFKTLHNAKFKPKIIIYGTNNFQEITFIDTFNSFKNALYDFINIIINNKKNDTKKITLKAIEIIERGNYE